MLLELRNLTENNEENILSQETTDAEEEKKWFNQETN